MMKNANDVVQTDLEYIVRNACEEFRELSGNRLLITGGAGFLGYYLTKSVDHWNANASEAEKVGLTVCDNFHRGKPGWLSDMQNRGALDVVDHDIAKPLPDDLGFHEYVIHAASIASPIYYRKYPLETMDANVNGLRILLDNCKAHIESGEYLKGFLYLSTSEIYGDPPANEIPTTESYRGHVSCTGPRACYDESKRYGETVAVNYARQFGMPIAIVRPFNNYGPGLKITDRRVVPDFARDVLSQKDIILLSDGSPTRTFCYVADAVVGYFKVLARGSAGEAYNIGVEAPEISILDLAHLISDQGKSLFNYRGNVVRKVSDDRQYLVDNPNRRCPCIEKARRDLGYNPSISLEEGLKRTMIWYSDNDLGEDK